MSCLLHILVAATLLVHTSQLTIVPSLVQADVIRFVDPTPSNFVSDNDLSTSITFPTSFVIVPQLTFLLNSFSRNSTAVGSSIETLRTWVSQLAKNGASLNYRCNFANINEFSFRWVATVGQFLQLFNFALTTFKDGTGAVTSYQVPFDTSKVLYTIGTDKVLTTTLLSGFSRRYLPDSNSPGRFKTVTAVAPGPPDNGALAHYRLAQLSSLIGNGSIFKDANTFNFAAQTIQPYAMNFTLFFARVRVSTEMVVMSAAYYSFSLDWVISNTSQNLHQITSPTVEVGTLLYPVIGMARIEMYNASQNGFPAIVDVTPNNENGSYFTKSYPANGQFYFMHIFFSQFCDTSVNCLTCRDNTTTGCIIEMSAGGLDVADWQCRSNQYRDSQKRCQNCSSGCISCTSATTCSACAGQHRPSTPNPLCDCFKGYAEDETGTCKFVLLPIGTIAAIASAVCVVLVAAGVLAWCIVNKKKIQAAAEELAASTAHIQTITIATNRKQRTTLVIEPVQSPLKPQPNVLLNRKSTKTSVGSLDVIYDKSAAVE